MIENISAFHKVIMVFMLSSHVPVHSKSEQYNFWIDDQITQGSHNSWSSGNMNNTIMELTVIEVTSENGPFGLNMRKFPLTCVKW